MVYHYFWSCFLTLLTIRWTLSTPASDMLTPENVSSMRADIFFSFTILYAVPRTMPGIEQAFENPLADE